MNAVILSTDFAARMEALFASDIEDSNEILKKDLGAKGAHGTGKRVVLAPRLILAVT